MKFIFRLIKLFVLLLILGLIFHDIAGKILLTGFLEYSLGVPVQVERVKLDLTGTQAEIRGLRLGNPSGFQEGTLAYLPAIFLDLEAGDLLQGRIHLQTLEIDCRDIRIVRNEDGKVNWLSLKALQSRKPKSESKNPSASGPPFLFQIDQLVLSLGTASYVDLYGTEPAQKSLNLNVHRTVFRNPGGFQGLVKVIVWETIKRVGVGQMTSAFENLAGQSTAKGILEKTFKGFKLKF